MGGATSAPPFRASADRRLAGQRRAIACFRTWHTTSRPIGAIVMVSISGQCARGGDPGPAAHGTVTGIGQTIAGEAEHRLVAPLRYFA